MNAKLNPSPQGTGTAVVEGEFLFTMEDFRQIAAILHGDSGIALNEGKVALVYSRLAKRLRALGIESFREYCSLLLNSDGVSERQMMLAALTTNVTSFFRENHHFEHLKAKVLPGLIEKAKAGNRVRIWSAACSTGQEPYSIAFTLLSMFPQAADYDIRILASDIDPNVVAEGNRGIYSPATVQSVPEDIRRKWMQQISANSDLAWRVVDEPRKLISFRELNLIGDWPMKGLFDVIFCRNVVIYFEEETQKKVWERFARRLAPGGKLYIGHSERLSGSVVSIFENDGLTTYKLRAK